MSASEHQLHPAMAAMQPLDNDGNPLLAKVHQAGGPLLGAPVTCEACGWRFERGTPARCPEGRASCPHTDA